MVRWPFGGLCSLFARVSAAFLLIAVLAARSDGVPVLDLNPICRGIAQQALDAGEGGPDWPDWFARCIRSEQTVRKRLVRKRSRYAFADKQNCIAETTTGGLASYTDLFSCLQSATEHAICLKHQNVAAMAMQEDRPTKIVELSQQSLRASKMARRAGGALLPAVQYHARFHFLRRADAARCAGREGCADASPRRKATLADHRFRCTERPGGLTALIDATTAPYVHKYQSVKKFLESPYQETRDVDIATITGVGSSALGSAALAWDISVALEKPVLAIVPGCDVADVVLCL
jgi:hypothetical protein